MRLVAAATLLLVLGACSSASPTTTPATTSTTAPTSGATSSPVDPALLEVDLPAATPGARTLLEVPARTGNFRRDDVAAAAGELRVLATCSGEGNVEIRYRSQKSITFQCSSHQALSWNGPETLPSADPLDVEVAAATGVTWALRLEQG